MGQYYCDYHPFRKNPQSLDTAFVILWQLILTVKQFVDSVSFLFFKYLSAFFKTFPLKL